jgi:hypothetical protein
VSEERTSGYTRRFRRRVSTPSTRSQYLPPELRLEAAELWMTVDKMYSKLVSAKIRKRVERIREGATIRQSKYRNWKAHVDDDD